MRPCRLVLALSLAGLVIVTIGLTRTVDSAEKSAATEPPGASAVFTSTDPLIIAARKQVEEGDFAEAERMLRGRADQSHPLADEMLDIIWRIRRAYCLDAERLVSKLRESIPDATIGDLERWRLAGQVQYRTIDGRVAYFAREPANILRFCEEAKKKRMRPPPATWAGWTLEEHLARVVAASQRENKAEVVPIRHRVRYTLTIAPGAPHLKRGALVRVWLPFPQECGRQHSVRLVSTSPAHQVLARGATDDRGTAGAPQRTIYFEQRAADPDKPLAFIEVFEFTTSAYYPQLDDTRAKPLSPNWDGRDLNERPPHILFTPRLARTVEQVVGNETNPLIKARKIFHFVAEHIAYCAEEEYSTIPSLSDKALASRRGDCGVQAMLFITMCRRAGIPARWQSGWQTKRVGCDMHDWAEFYVEPWGWLPADPSYGLRDSPDARIREFYFGHQDAYRLIVNRDYGQPLVPPKRSLRSEPLDFQRGEVEIDGHNLYFPYWDYDISIEWLDDGP